LSKKRQKVNLKLWKILHSVSRQTDLIIAVDGYKMGTLGDLGVMFWMTCEERKHSSQKVNSS